MTKEEFDALSRDITPEEEAAIVGLAESALRNAATTSDAAEMLVCASTLILVRQFGPRSASAIFNRFVDAQRRAFRNHVQ